MFHRVVPWGFPGGFHGVLGVPHLYPCVAIPEEEAAKELTLTEQAKAAHVKLHHNHNDIREKQNRTLRLQEAIGSQQAKLAKTQVELTGNEAAADSCKAAEASQTAHPLQPQGEIQGSSERQAVLLFYDCRKAFDQLGTQLAKQFVVNGASQAHPESV